MIPLFKVYMSKAAANDVKQVLESGYIGQGPKVEEFEKVLKERFQNDYVLTMNSATSAEHLALHLLKAPQEGWPGIQPGDEVLASPLTCTASNWPILAHDFRIKWVDIDPHTLNMDLDDLARKITPSTKAIMAVHWGGYPLDLDRLKQIQLAAKEINGFKPAIIEDSAHSFGATYKGKPLGSHGNINTFSFQAIKHLTSVDGGALVLPHQRLYNRGKLLRWYGIDRECNRKDFRCELDIEEYGFKFHMNDVNATIGLANLKEVDKEVIQKHKANSKRYFDAFQNIPGLTLLENAPDRESACWLFTMKVERRDDFTRHMTDKGIAVSRVHERNDLHTCTRDFRVQLPSLEKVMPEMICIPNGWWLTEDEREYIVDCVKEGW